jgi:hypothetical protein
LFYYAEYNRWVPGGNAVTAVFGLSAKACAQDDGSDGARLEDATSDHDRHRPSNALG